MDELWIDRLAKDANIEPETSARLWQALCSQIETRLSLGTGIQLREMGYWAARTEAEYLALLPNQERYIIPPTIRLSISHAPEQGREYVDLPQLCEALVQATEVRPEAVGRWLEAIEPRLARSMSSGRQIGWAGLGVFTPIVEAGGLRGFSFAPEDALSEVLNRPFGMFSPVAVLSSEAVEGLSVREVETLEQCLASSPIEVLIQPREELVQEPTLVDSVVVEPTMSVEPMEHPEDEATEPSAPAEDLPAASGVSTIESPPPVDVSQAPEPHGDQATAVAGDAQVDEALEQSAVYQRKSSRGRWLGLFILLVILVGIWALWRYLERRPATTSQPQLKLPTHTELVTSPPYLDTTMLWFVSTPVRSPLVAQENGMVAKPVVEDPIKPPPQTSATSPKVIEAEEIVIKPGDSLVQIALRKYGHKAFWVYIYEENRERIKNPDNIPLGTRLSLPAARKYGIDSSNTNSVSRALSLQRALLKNKKK
ncbi:MAG: hypothetical protein Q4A64_00855 [Porphyromonadaceae bacterium]|nr:hypothetical protein [Porphyromonadaceae bacterium]